MSDPAAPVQVSGDIRRRALLLIRDALLREVQSCLLTRKGMVERFTAADLPLPETAEVLQHAAGVALGMARQIPITPVDDHPEVAGA